MSKMERNKGILSLATMGEVLRVWPEAKEDDLPWSTDGNYMRINGEIYQVFWKEKSTDVMYFADTKRLSSGDIAFHTSHYNGAGSLEEVIEDGLSDE